MLTLLWKGTAPEESIRAVRESLVALLQQNKSLIILNDVQQLFAAEAGLLRELGTAEWDRLVANMGIKALVHVLKPESEIPIEPENESSGLLTIKYFHSKFDAIEWINAYLKELEG